MHDAPKTVVFVTLSALTENRLLIRTESPDKTVAVLASFCHAAA
jgi:hypothetical protein